MIVASFSVIPMGAGASAGRYIRAVHEMLKKSGVRVVVGAMSTTIEADSFEQICLLVEKANGILVDMEVPRVITTVTIDYRVDKEISIDSKLDSLR
ncbi:MAG: hypothetical protein A4E45_01028 [Methanosaeta sp. PtaB.Bin039]|nr:MAG: hypothetical protein A4E45_01028 [Methanosaeta sp. PtaB.Bin039]OPY45872.1 MAG: hypothetical protein A4E47_00821 [Methanosaeta sp. PtaU1.Bin028]HOT07824.1 MTH1187 family thiamine-binding protein [Methanotrichaceae archaeon]HQF17543.1 MTH1187 family thiamine-binding protein [Methanotrichaceae archaeon]HQI92115.1 MTH1187 family thiamine-binding protein [Methanotrichaceae archaeon]